MESSLSAARDALKEAVTRLEAVVPKVDLDRPMTLNAVTPSIQTFETSFGREVSNFPSRGIRRRIRVTGVVV
jgi:hypothetical protein